MPQALRIILGAVSAHEARALLVTQGHPGSAPSVEVEPRGGPTRRIVPRRLVPNEPVASLLAAQGVELHLVLLDGLASAVDHDVRAALAAAPLEVAARFRTLPTSLPSEGLTFAFGSCLFDGVAGKAPWYAKAVDRLASCLPSVSCVHDADARPSFVCLLGDNVYLDIPMRGANVVAPTASLVVDRYLDYFLRGGPVTRLRAALPSFTTYDDHEYWNDYPDGPYWNEPPFMKTNLGSYEHAARECLRLFQCSLNPVPAPYDREWFRFDVDPVSFFFVDTRSSRTKAGSPAPKLVRDDTLAAIADWAENLRGPGFLAMGQPLWLPPVDHLGGLELVPTSRRPSAFTRQYQALITILAQAPYDVAVLAGDLHTSQVVSLSFDPPHDTRKLYELVSSPLARIPDGLDATKAIPTGVPSRGRPKLAKPRDVPTGRPVRVHSLFSSGANSTYGLVRIRPSTGIGFPVDVSFIAPREGGAGRGAFERIDADGADESKPSLPAFSMRMR